MQMTLWCSGVCLVCSFMWLFRYLSQCFPVLLTNEPTIAYKRNFYFEVDVWRKPKRAKKEGEIIHDRWTNCVKLVLLLK